MIEADEVEDDDEEEEEEEEQEDDEDEEEEIIGGAGGRFLSQGGFEMRLLAEQEITGVTEGLGLPRGCDSRQYSRIGFKWSLTTDICCFNWT